MLNKLAWRVFDEISTIYDNAGMRNYDEFLRLLLLEVKKKGWSKKEFAGIMGKTPTWASQLFTGKKYPDGTRRKTELTVPLLLEISGKLGVDLGLLLSGHEGSSVPVLTFPDFIREICRDEIKKSKL